MNSNMQCPICGSTNNIILENNSQKILKLRHPGLLFLIKNLPINLIQGAFAQNVI